MFFATRDCISDLSRVATISECSDEVAKASTNLGHTLSAEELDEAMAEMDKDGDETVDFEEFLTYSAQLHYLFVEIFVTACYCTANPTVQML